MSNVTRWLRGVGYAVAAVYGLGVVLGLAAAADDDVTGAAAIGAFLWPAVLAIRIYQGEGMMWLRLFLFLAVMLGVACVPELWKMWRGRAVPDGDKQP